MFSYTRAQICNFLYQNFHLFPVILPQLLYFMFGTVQQLLENGRITVRHLHVFIHNMLLGSRRVDNVLSFLQTEAETPLLYKNYTCW